MTAAVRGASRQVVNDDASVADGSSEASEDFNAE